MADIIENQQQISPEAAAKAELDQQMIYAGVLAPTEQSAQSGQQAGAGGETTETSNQPPAFSFDTVKQKFGYNAPEDMMTEIEQLRALKANPPLPTFEFENEDSKRLFESWKGGKTKEVYEYLAQQNRLDELLTKEVDKDSAADIVKHDMQLKYKNLKPAEIEYKFKKQFGLPPKPVQGSEEEAEQYNSRVAAWQETVEDKQMELIIEAKTALPNLEASKAKLIFPDIEQQADPEYLNYKKAVEEKSKLAAEAVQAYKAYTPETIETKINFNDEANGVAFDFQYKPDAESFAQAQAMVTDIEKFYDQFQNQDGTPDRKKFMKTIYNALNMEKMLTAAMVQAKNATLKSILPDNSQTSGLVRHLTTPVGQPSEIDEAMARQGIRKG